MSEYPTFNDFYSQVYERAPFPWQEALASRVAQRGWPEAISVPTGLGKTVALVIGVWDLAWQLREGGERSAPLRILHVVDRTAIVDQTHRDITTLREVLERNLGEESPAGIVATALAQDFGSPLITGKVHGTHRDDDWVSAHRPVVATMTAHQAVSRALFRGFGISTRMAPVHAATVGMDSLVVIDEPHLSTATVKTLRTAKELQARHDSVGVPVGAVVSLGATLFDSSDDTLTITDVDRAHPVAGRRLGAPKALTQHTTSADSAAQVQSALIRLAKRELVEHPGRPVAVVCNTVDVARNVHATLTKSGGPVTSAEAMLVTSRIRGFERRRLDEALTDLTGVRLIVATQTIEAGLDISVPTLVTETCGWQALIQRLGRLNRYGLEQGRAYVVTTVRPETTRIYGDTAKHTSTLLRSLPESADVSSDGLARIAEEHSELVKAATGSAPHSPALTRQLLPTLVQTKPRPAADVNVQPFITGVRDDERVADVQVLWRHHCEPDVLAVMRPSALEQVTVPVAAVRQLLANRLEGKSAKSVLSDAAASDTAVATSLWRTNTAVGLVNDGSGWQPLTHPSDITPGATIVLESRCGGHDHTGWNPDSHEPVIDLSAYLAFSGGRWWLADEYSLAALRKLGAVSVVPERTVWDSFSSETDPDDIPDLVRALLPVELHDLEASLITDRGVWLRTTASVSEESPGLVALQDHRAHVAQLAYDWAQTLRLPEELSAVITAAAYHHDDGKCELAFQSSLGATPTCGVLAKEHPAGPGPRGGLPRGWRHESLSAHLTSTDGHSDLTTHLVAAHHGWARPLMPPVDGHGQNMPTDRTFRRYTEQYGPWGLAWLETLVRLADHEASAQPEAGHHVPGIAFPRHAPVSQGRAEPSSVELSGIPLYSHMTWWAAAGALAAASLLDPEAGLHFALSEGGLVPVLTSTVDVPTLASQVVHVREQIMELSRTHVTLTTKWEKAHAEHVRATLADLDSLPELQARIAAALLDDTQPARANGSVSLRVPWHHTNSNLIDKTEKLSHTVEAIAHALLHDTPDQHDARGHFGLTPAEAQSKLVTGMPDDSRSVLLPLVLAAAACVPSTGGPRATGTTSNRQRRVPLPKTPTTWQRLVTLLQTLPQNPQGQWHHLGVDSRSYTETLVNLDRGKAWIHP